MPVHTADLDQPAAPARLARATERTPAHWALRTLAVSFGAMLLAFGFTASGRWWAVPLGVAAVVVSVFGARFRQATALGAWGGMLFAVVNLGWLTSVGIDAAMAMAILFSAWWAVTALAIRIVLNLTLWPLLVPTVWVGQEWARSTWPLGGFPWARLGYASVESPLANWIPFLGVYGMTFVLAALGTGLAAAVLWRGRRRVAAGVAIVAVVAVAAVVTGSGASLRPGLDPRGRVFDVAVVQGGPQQGVGLDQARAVLTAHAAQTRALASRGDTPYGLVLWPESSTDIDPFVDVWARAEIESAVSAIDAPIVVGAVTGVPSELGRVRNQAIAWLPATGPGASYTKRQLVPFGEYVPARGLLERLSSRFADVPRDFVAGDDQPVLQVGRISLGVLICFEVAFDDRVRDAINAGATILAVPSNNATYQGTAQPGQQLEIARFRALETGRAVLVASTTGVSAIVDRQGDVMASLEDGGAGVLVGSVTASTEVTTAVRWGGALGGILALVAFASLAMGTRRSLQSRNDRRRG